MSTLGGPNNVRDGLVLHIDAANNKCFRGEPTVNLRTDIQIVNYNTGQYVYHGLEQSGQFKGWYKLTATSTSFNKLIVAIAGISALANTTHTVSLEWVSPNNSLSFELNGTGGFGVVSDSIGETNRFFKTFTPKVNGTYNLYLRSADGSIGSIANGVMYFRNIQWEQKPYSTPYVNGTRGTTVDTGGGLIDLSKNGNNGENISGITYSSESNGCLVFDGTTGYINIPNNDNLVFGNNDFSVDMWIKTPITSVGEGSPSQWGPIISKGCSTSAPAGTWWLAQTSASSNGITFNASSTTGGTFVTSLSTTLPDGWHNITVKREGTTAYMYVDGGFLSSDNTSSSNLSSDAPLNICKTASASLKRVGATISNVKIYNRALSDAEILQNYNATKSRFGL